MEENQIKTTANPQQNNKKDEMKEKYSHIKGWGIDYDPKNEPTYPIKKYTGDDHKRYDWERPPQQQSDIEVLKSIERPDLPAVYGTSMPPSGVSGQVRRIAFKYSESDLRHWMLLAMADRINVVEGVIEDIAHGHLPNIFAEKGWKADWKHNKPKLAVKVLSMVAAVSAIAILMTRKKKQRRYAFWN